MSESDATKSVLVRASQRRRATPGVVVVFSGSGPVVPPRAVAVTQATTVGRASAADLTLDDDSASREHALLEPGSQGLLVTDRGSHNGTLVDGRRVDRERSSAPVGATLRFGSSLLRVVADVAPFEKATDDLPGLVGGPSLEGAKMQIRQVAPTTTPVLVQGETGTGKEKVAEAIHALSGRKGRFVAVNCAALPADLVEAELFGHTRGAYSGADGARQGLFRAADGGTLLLDEIGELPAASQAKLLRVLETSEVRPVGSDSVVKVDVRIVAATNRSLRDMSRRGQFRSDLMHRIAVWPIRMPALRERLEDVPALVEHFLADDPLPLSADFVEDVLAAEWTGNVRELRNAVAAARAKARALGDELIEPEHLPPGEEAEDGDRARAMASNEGEDASLRAKLETALQLREGNVSQVARDLAMRRPAVYEALRRLGVDPRSYRRS